MAKALWGKVFFKDSFAGYLSEEPGNRMSFRYDSSYLDSKLPPIAHTLPLQENPFMSDDGLHPFFDNLVAEGWLERTQTRLLGKRIHSRFELLLAFGHDCAGAVSAVDPVPEKRTPSLIDVQDPKELALITSRASLSGVQPKITLIQREGKFFPTGVSELSTYIAKFPSKEHPNLIVNEFLTTQAFKELLPDDDVVDLTIGEVEGFAEVALIIKRFDRRDGERVHFEEFNQLLGKKSYEKYNASHGEMADFIKQTKGCLLVENYRLFGRVLAGLLLGNTDMHLKNFAMFHGPQGLRLTPSYDQVSAAIYDYKTVALAIRGASELVIGNLKPKNILILGGEFGIPEAATEILVQKLDRRREAAKEAIQDASVGGQIFKNKLIKLMDARWNGTFALIGHSLSKRRSSAAKSKD